MTSTTLEEQAGIALHHARQTRQQAHEEAQRADVETLLGLLGVLLERPLSTDEVQVQFSALDSRTPPKITHQGHAFALQERSVFDTKTLTLVEDPLREPLETLPHLGLALERVRCVRRRDRVNQAFRTLARRLGLLGLGCFGFGVYNLLVNDNVSATADFVLLGMVVLTLAVMALLRSMDPSLPHRIWKSPEV